MAVSARMAAFSVGSRCGAHSAECTPGTGTPEARAAASASGSRLREIRHQR